MPQGPGPVVTLVTIDSYCAAWYFAAMVREAQQQRLIDIIIPFYRNSQFVAQIVQSLKQMPVQHEMSRLKCSVTLVNDSPEDYELTGRLREAAAGISSVTECRLLENDRNIGFVRSVNRGAQQALERGCDVILLNSDTVVFPGAFSEMRRVAYLDPMIGFVSPRSNNATICSLPHQDQYKTLAAADSYRVFRRLADYLPQFHFVPTAVGFCLFIKWEILKEFGVFDESYGHGYHEENDLILRANRCGYRAALANHAFVYHVGEASFAANPVPKRREKEKNAALLEKRYPEYRTSVAKYMASPRYEAEDLLAALLPDVQDRLDLLFDCSHIGPDHNGTTRLCMALLKEAAACWDQFHIHVMISEEARRIHNFDRLARVSFVPPDLDGSRKFAIGFRLGQPFQLQQMLRLSRLSVVNVYGMLDPIAFDCHYLDAAADLDLIWGSAFTHADGVVYISDFARDLFRRRFPMRPSLQELVVYPSLRLEDYRSGSVPANPAQEHILVIGNKFEHKRLVATVEALRQAFPNDTFVVLGDRRASEANVIWYTSGELPETTMRELWAGARFVVFPSTYEGFGFPILESLAFERPVLARSMQVSRYIQQKTGQNSNLILYSSTSELVELLQKGFPFWQTDSGGQGSGSCWTWESAARQVGQFLDQIVTSVDSESVLLPRLRQMHLLKSIIANRELAAAVRDREEQIQDLRNSWSWRFTQPLRWAGSAYLRLLGK